MNAEIITIGDEILIGQITDTNSAWLGQELNKLGIKVVHKCAVADSAQAITDALTNAQQRAELVILTGGLGPTKDDVTKKTLAKFYNVGFIENLEVKNWVTKIFRLRKLPIIDLNMQQALVPENCQVLFNKNGTAPGMWFDENNKVTISLPGVPFEMKSLFTEECIPKIKSRFAVPHILHRTILTCNIGESFLAQKIETFENELPEFIKLAYLPSIGVVRLRLSGYHTDGELLTNAIKREIEKLYALIKDNIFGEEDTDLQTVIGQLLLQQNATLATAESCTGGYLAHLITSVPGSSAYFQGSIISYANDVKINQLAVSAETLKVYGAVSQECVTEMALNIKEKLNTTYSIATSGIAGPGGGTEDKPVGTVWIAVAGPNGVQTLKSNFGDNRERTIIRTAVMAFDLLRKMLLENV